MTFLGCADLEMGELIRMLVCNLSCDFKAMLTKTQSRNPSQRSHDNHVTLCTCTS